MGISFHESLLVVEHNLVGMVIITDKRFCYSSDEPQPIVEEPETPEAAPEAAEPEPEVEQAEVSEDEIAEPDVTDEE